jgi:hypothetical protein
MYWLFGLVCNVTVYFQSDLLLHEIYGHVLFMSNKKMITDMYVKRQILHKIFKNVIHKQRFGSIAV